MRVKLRTGPPEGTMSFYEFLQKHIDSPTYLGRLAEGFARAENSPPVDGGRFEWSDWLYTRLSNDDNQFVRRKRIWAAFNKAWTRYEKAITKSAKLGKELWEKARKE